MRKFLKVVLSLLVFLLAVVCIRAALVKSRQVAAPTATGLDVDEAAAAAHLAGAVRIATVSHEEGANPETEAFSELHRYLEATFPRVHAALGKEVVATSSLLYTWKGSDPSLPPLLLLAHQDVVPVEPGTESKWTHGAFSGDLAGGYVWGRGTLDDKVGVLSILEGAEWLLAHGFQPKRTVLLAFGHDEEVGGERGAKAVAALLQQRGVKPLMILDEGGAIAEPGMVPGVKRPVALVGTAEKGFVSLELVAESAGGHSSMPPRHTAIGLLSAAITKLEANPMPARIDGATKSSFDFLAAEMPFGQRAFLTNLWLFGPVARKVFSADPAADTRIRTSTAATVFQSGIKDNVLPHQARAVVNFRILPGDTVADVQKHVKDTVGKDIQVKISGGFFSEPPPQAPVDSEAFRLLQTTIAQVFPGSVTAPNLLSGATDSRHYIPLSPNVYRFHPMRVKPEDLARVHGIDERIGVKNYAEVVRFYAQLLRNVGG